jgi:hypothetical protein
MDERAMTDMNSVPLLVILPICFAGGVVLGFAYFRALRTTADLIVGGGNPFLGLALALGRLAFLGAGLYVAVLFGGLALLAALVGVLCAKGLMLNHARRADT